MIEKLFRPHIRYGEPEYSRQSAEIHQVSQALSKILAPDHLYLLEKLEECYLAREDAETRSAFAECFCSAAWLAVDILKHWPKNEAD